MPAELPKTVTLSPDALFQELEGNAVLLNLNSERYYGLEGSGARLWQLLGEYGEPEVVVREMLKQFAVDEQVLRADLANLIAGLADAGLLSVGDAAESDSAAEQAD